MLGPRRLKYQLMRLGRIEGVVPMAACRGAASGSLAIIRVKSSAKVAENTAVRLERRLSAAMPAAANISHYIRGDLTMDLIWLRGLTVLESMISGLQRP